MTSSSSPPERVRRRPRDPYAAERHLLPNLIVIGASKAGTTSLHFYLDLHPEIAMSRIKELRFFVRDASRADVVRYGARFRPAPVRGESSPQYSSYPRFPGVPARMHALIPDVRLVYLVRDPVERAWVGHGHSVADGRHTWMSAFADFDRSETVQVSRYAMQLEQYLRYFDLERILVVPFEDLRDSRVETLRRVFRFAGVRDDFVSPQFEDVKNTVDEKRQKRRAGVIADRALKRVLGGPRAVNLMIRAPAIVKAPFTRPFERPEMPNELRDRLTEYLAPDAERLRAMTGLPFDRWSV